MKLLADVAEWSILAFAGLLFLAQVVAREAGYWFGRRHADGAKERHESIAVVTGAILALLAFVLALTLSFANARFAERRAGALAEANAIGTAWLRAEAIGDPRGFAIARQLEDYARVRSNFVSASRDPATLEALNARTAELQTQIWGNVSAVVRARPDAISTSLMASLNEVFDMSAAERFAFDFTMPPPLFWLLITMVLVGMAALGMQFGLKRSPTRLLATLLTIVWTFVLVDILDLAAPRLGAINTSTAIYQWTIEGFGKDVIVPPPPAGGH